LIKAVDDVKTYAFRHLRQRRLLSDALGDVYTFGDAPNDGSMAGTHLNGSIMSHSP
jgi:hydroxymethylpyrimidine pyrophosphatase-like HAD family hydrolase